MHVLLTLGLLRMFFFWGGGINVATPSSLIDPWTSVCSLKILIDLRTNHSNFPFHPEITSITILRLTTSICSCSSLLPAIAALELLTTYSGWTDDDGIPMIFIKCSKDEDHKLFGGMTPTKILWQCCLPTTPFHYTACDRLNPSMDWQFAYIVQKLGLLGIYLHSMLLAEIFKCSTVEPL